MGEAKRRGTHEERVADAATKHEARERAWNEAQAERRRQRQEMEREAPVRTQATRRTPNRLLLTAVLALAAAGVKK